jgi:Transcriptional regulator containing PAS, AAA-type ATPase, and DNA-binding domains
MLGGRPARLLDEAFNALIAHNWPGNVRELRNVLERAAILSDGEIGYTHLSFPRRRSAAPPPVDLRTAERVTIERMLRETGWNKSKAARRLGLTRTQLYGRLRRHGLDAPISGDVAVA